MVGEDAGGGEGLDWGERVGDELTAVCYSGGGGSGSGSFSRDDEV